MPRFLVMLHNPDAPHETRVVEWSTIVDAPVAVLSYDDLVCEPSDRLARVLVRGHSWLVHPEETPATLIEANRAGPNESELDMRGLWARYSQIEESE
jgi:hypothetical protein